VKSRIARARDNLRGLLAKACPEFAPAVAAGEWFDPARASGRREILCA
jgi:RNA polymerase sigma-70 factor (ECF subfamily)